MKAKYLLIFISFLFLSNAFAQKEFNNWYFGKNAAITFNTGNGSPVSLNNSAMYQFEGCSSISDRDGHLLFYTNGEDVFNMKHTKMPRGFGLNGDNSSTTSAFIVPMPGDTNRYYIFTADQGGYMMGSEPKGIGYSIVDMRLDSGRGDVSVKNVEIFKPATEKIAAVRHSNRRDIWIISHEWQSDAFRAYLLTDNGLSSAPVISHAGSVHQGDLTNTIGYIKSSFRGDMLAVVTYGGTLELFNFNNRTGEISLKNKIDLMGGYLNYGVEFSHDGTKLYYNDGDHYYNQYIYQLDLADTSKGKYAMTRLSDKGNFASIQMGPDGKIYVADNGQYSLSVIHYPDQPQQACSFRLNELNLTGVCLYGLPVDVRGNAPVVIASSNGAVCEGSDIILGFSLESDSDSLRSVLWRGPNGFQSLERNPVIHQAKPSMSGEYTVTVRFDNFIDSASVNVRVYPRPVVRTSPAGTVPVCVGSSAQVAAITENPGGKYRYFWSTGDTSRVISVSQPGSYSLVIIDSNGCSSGPVRFDVVIYKSEISVSPASPAFICQGSPALLECMPISPGIVKYKWSTGDTTKSISASQPGTYWVYAIDSNGCASDKISIEVFYYTNNVSVTGIQAGSTYPGNEYNGHFVLSNSGKFKVHINRITVNSPELTIGGYSDNINPGESANVPYTFRPDQVKVYEFIIIIESDQPCAWEDTLKLKMNTISMLKAWLPDTTANIGDKNFALPLFAKLNYCGAIREGRPYIAEIRYNASLFMPDESAMPGLKESRIENSERILVIEGTLPALNDFGAAILEISGSALLGSDSITPLLLRRFEILDSNEKISVETGNGSLRTRGVCVQSLSRVKSYVIPSLSVQPNPARDVINVILYGTTGRPLSLDIFSMQGIMLHTEEWEATNSTSEIRINVKDFPAGVYYITARCTAGTVSQCFVVVE